MKLTLYKQSATPNRVNKAPYLSSVGELNNVIIKDTDNTLTPDFILSANPVIYNANYFYCDFTGRFYYITGCDITTGGRIIVHSRVDVLMTYRNEILNSSAWVDVSDSTTDTSEGYEFLHNDYPFRQDYKILGKSTLDSPFNGLNLSGVYMTLLMK